MNLNASQRQAVLHKEGPCLVIAGPGSGKTHVLTKRVRELINSGVPAEQILVITFTKAAAIEMKERFEGLSEEKAPVTFGTFHSLFWGIIQKEEGYRSNDIVMGQMRIRLLNEAMDMASIPKDDTVLRNAYISELSQICNSLIKMDDYVPKYVEASVLKDFIRAYYYLKKKYHLIDFDDMLLRSYQLFKAKPQILKKWQDKFSFFLVDEMQDMNDLQFQLIRMLSAKTNNLFCVGDDDQSIYGFRGANPKIMREFMDFYPLAAQIILDYNYRNPENIVSAATNLIKFNDNRFSKVINSVSPRGIIEIIKKPSPEEEAEEIYNKISELVKTGVPFDEFAILYRNHTDARYMVDKIVNSGMPFYLKEKIPNIYTHFIISDIEAYFQLAIGNITKGRLLGILNRPNRYLHRQSVENGATREDMLRFYQQNPLNYRTVDALWSDITLLGKMSPVAAISYIRKAIGYESFLTEEAIKNQTEIIEYIEILDFITEVFRDCRTVKAAIDKLNILRLKIDFENKNRNVDKAGKIGLYTLHSSKGLEFENVFIISANDGIIPSNKVESKDDMEGERRLFYVGITRSKRNLFISYNNKKNRDKSRFLDELKLEDYSSPKSSSQISSKRFETTSYSSSDSMFSSDGAPVSSSK